jgi:uncharacterized repeat protein (TIGR03843 family)
VSSCQRVPANATVSIDVGPLLDAGVMEIEGRLIDASNATFVASVTLDGLTRRCVYKPIRGERPLWDFPTGSLAGREVAARMVSDWLEWHLVPQTVLRDGPFGRGMCQLWIDTDDRELVDLVPVGRVKDGWLRVLDAEDQYGHPVSLVHADDPGLARMAVFDVLVNNADRKGGHLLPTSERIYGVDHGVTFHADPKLRTVLWGWASEPIPDDVLEDVVRFRARLDEERSVARLCQLVSPLEVVALRRRTTGLVRRKRFPNPGSGWPSIPWPAF